MIHRILQKVSWFALFAILSVGACRRASPPALSLPASREQPYIMIKDVRPWGEPDSTLLQVSLAPEAERTLYDLHDYAAEHFPDGQWNNYGPDMSYRQVVLVIGGHRFDLRSCHPVVEKNPNLVAASYGITPLQGEPRRRFLARDNQSYVAARRAFDRIQQVLLTRFAERGELSPGGPGSSAIGVPKAQEED